LTQQFSGYRAFPDDCCVFQAANATNHRSDELLTVRETADFLKFTVETTRKLIREGSIPACKVGGSIRVNRDELLAAVAARPIVTRVEDTP
jgi:excisionase family DNA binding protein